MSFSKMETFIEEVKKYPCLWDTNIISYRDLGRKEIAWENVSKECGLSNGKEAKSQWKRLRDSHREALRRRKISTSQTAQNCKPWKYEKLLEFLHTQSNTETSSKYLNAADLEPNIEIYSPEHAAEEDAVQSRVPNIRKKILNKGFVDVLTQRDRRREQHQDERDELRRQALDSNRFIHQHDALLNLFMSLYEKTKALPKYLQLRVQRQVFKAVTKAEEEALAYDTCQYDYKFFNHSPYHHIPYSNQYSEETDSSLQSAAEQHQNTSSASNPMEFELSDILSPKCEE